MKLNVSIDELRLLCERVYHDFFVKKLIFHIPGRVPFAGKRPSIVIVNTMEFKKRVSFVKQLLLADNLACLSLFQITFVRFVIYILTLFVSFQKISPPFLFI